MEYNDSNTHVIKTSAQWNERAIEYWVVPRGCLCVELTPKGKTKIKIGEGNKNYYQLPYIGSTEELYNYYTKEEVDALLNNFNRMAIMSTDEYPSKRDLPMRGNKVGDVRFVAPSSPDIKPDPDLYVWDGRRWIFTGSPLVDMSEYVKTSEFNIVKNKVDQIFPMAHTHANKDVLDNITQEKLDEIDELAEMYDDVKTDITDLKSKSHTHQNKRVLDIITDASLWSSADREKFANLHNYDDTEVKGRLTVVESKAHTHDNKSVLDGITQEKLDEITELAATYIIVKHDIAELKEKEHSHDNIDILNETDASYTIAQQNELNRLSNIGPFLGCGPTWNGIFGYVPAPEMGQQTYFLRADGTWAKVKSEGDKYKAGEGITILSGEIATDTFPFKVYSKSARLKQYVIYGAIGGVGNQVSSSPRIFNIPITVTSDDYGTRQSIITTSDPLYEGDYIDYNRQVFVHTRTNIMNQLSVDPSHTYKKGIYADGTIGYFDPGAYGDMPNVSMPFELDTGAAYEIPAFSTWTDSTVWRNFKNGIHVNMYDANMNRTRTISLSFDNATLITPTTSEKYLRMTCWRGSGMTVSQPAFIQIKDVETPVILQEVVLYPNTINTIDVNTTIKPSEIYVEVDEPIDPDPDDPMSEYTGVIYNDGVLDITQEDPNNLNELTVHFRDNVDKTITIPASTLPIASDTTLGGIKVGDNLTIDPETGVLSADGEKYIAGNGIEFTRTSSVLPSGYIQFEYVESLGSQSYIDTGVSHGFTAYMDLQYIASNHRQLMGLELSSGTYIGSNASEQFEMYRSMANSDTTQRNNVIWHHDEINPSRLEVNGSSITDSSSIGRSNKTFKIFSPFASDGYGSSVRIYNVDIYDNNNTLIRRFIPCESPSNIVGMYDLVNDVFYPPTGASLNAGQQVGNVTINAKLGDGLDFDSNDAIKVQPATTTTIGGIIVGENLTIDENGVLSATGGGSSGGNYEAGTGINIISDSGSTVSRTLKVNAQTAQANDYTIYGASGGVGEPSINLMPALTMSSIWSDTWYADGTHEGKPAFSKNTWYGGITNEVYLTEGTYTFSLDVKLSSTSIQGILANQLNDRSRYPHYDQAATVDRMEYGPFYPVDTDWHRYSYTFEVTSAGYVACRAENVSAEHGTISVARAQLERGSVAHDYVEHDCYTIPITVSAPNETDIEVFIETSSPLGNGDSLNFIDDALPTLTLYQNKINMITINTTVAPSRFSVDASAGSDVTSVIELDDSITIRFNCDNDPNEY